MKSFQFQLVREAASDTEADEFSVHEHCVPEELVKDAIRFPTGTIVVMSEDPAIPVFDGAPSDDVEVGDFAVSDVTAGDVEVGDVEVGEVEVGEVAVGEVEVEEFEVGDVEGDVDWEDLPPLFSLRCLSQFQNSSRK